MDSTLRAKHISLSSPKDLELHRGAEKALALLKANITRMNQEYLGCSASKEKVMEDTGLNVIKESFLLYSQVFP